MKELEDPLISILIIVLVLSFLFPITASASSVYSLPDTITVRVTGEKECRAGLRYTTQQIDFKEYVKGVLPNEWGMTWNEESLKAGAVAVKMYAWTMYWGRGYVWDCTWSQVYDPEIKSKRTDKAVDETWDYILVSEQGLVRTFYNAWIGGCYVQEEENCMGQWNSKNDADWGMTWQEILGKYYEGELICPNCDSNDSLEKAEIPINLWNITDRRYTLYQYEFMR